MCWCVSLTVVSYPWRCFHHHLWTFLKVGIGHHTSLTSSLLSLSLLDLLIASEGHDSVMHERPYVIGGLFLMRCSAGFTEASQHGSCQIHSLRDRLFRTATPEGWLKPQTHTKFKRTSHKSHYSSLFVVFVHRIPPGYSCKSTRY